MTFFCFFAIFELKIKLHSEVQSTFYLVAVTVTLQVPLNAFSKMRHQTAGQFFSITVVLLPACRSLPPCLCEHQVLELH